MHITIIGAGYVGTTTGLMFAELGCSVTCVDAIREKVDRFNQGKLPFYEPGLDDALIKHLERGNISFTTNIKKAVQDAEIVYIAVGTPAKADGSTDLRYVRQTASALAESINGYKIIVMKSTVPVGTTEKLKNWIQQEQTTAVPFDVAANPEFLREGSAFYDTMNPDRIIIGAEQETSANRLLSLYSSFQSPKLVVSIRTAEMIKYAANAFLSTRISYINEIAKLCDQLGVDVVDVARGIGLDHRIGQSAIHAGIGWGGSCFPKDISSLIHMGDGMNRGMELLKSVRRINDEQIDYYLDKIERVLGALDGKVLAVLGLSFKPNTDDIRESPALKLIPKLLEKKAIVKLSDPVALGHIRHLWPEVIRHTDPQNALRGADACLLITDWEHFIQADWKAVKNIMNTPIIFDGRNCLDPNQMAQIGFCYYGIGRGKPMPDTAVVGNA
jgi:UDPglucose 6-dehydrogenase